MKKQNKKIRRIPNRRGNKEKWIMTVSSVFVLTALTVIGVVAGRQTSAGQDGYVVDFSGIEEKKVENNSQVLGKQLTEEIPEQAAVENSDLDYDPYFQETNSGNVENENTLQAKIDAASQTPDPSTTISGTTAGTAGAVAGVATTSTPRSEQESHSDSMSDGAKDALSTAMQPTLSFTESDPLVWPIVGNVLINYSMDHTVYFPTLEQYKYNPAIVIQAVEGETITAAAAGRVKEIFQDPQLGTGITVELGNGYELTYGQLTNVLVSEGSFVSIGDALADVAAPTRYYSVEGCNVYFKLTKDGTPANPLTRLQ